MSKNIYTLNEAMNEKKEILGGKGYYIAQLRKLKEELDLKADVPDAFILPTSLWKEYDKNKKSTIEEIKKNIIPKIIKGFKEQSVDGVFPLVSVRSGAPVSMPGMMDTILNLGMDETNIGKYEEKNKNWAQDCYSRYLTMFGEIALNLNKEELHKLRKKKYKSIEEIKDTFEKYYKKNKVELPKTVEEQLLVAIISILESWNNERAVIYRKMENIDNNLGTAIIIQKMVFGNLNEKKSATAVVFSRNTNTGSMAISGEFLVNAQGEDVVSGAVTPNDIDDMKQWNKTMYEDIRSDVKKLEKHFKDVQDVELTIEDGKLYFLQTRVAKRTPVAALKIAVDMVDEGLIEKEELFSRIDLKDYLSVNTRQIDTSYKVAADAVGLSASSGVLVGRVVFDLRGLDLVEEGKPTILLATETTPDDMALLKEVSGVVTCVGGVTSHAAVVARSLNKVAIVGTSDIKVHLGEKREDFYAMIGGQKVVENDEITIDGETGRIWIGNDVPIVDGSENKNVLKIEDMIFDIYPFMRAISDINDLFSDKNVIYATYKLDTETESKIEEDLFTAIEIMQDSEPEDYKAVIDLQGKLDFIENSLEEKVPFTETLGLDTFKTKLEILMRWSGDKNKFSVYLGKYYDDFHKELEDYGFNVLKTKDLKMELGKDVEINNKSSLTIVDKLSKSNIEKPSKNLIISGKNALISLLGNDLKETLTKKNKIK